MLAETDFKQIIKLTNLVAFDLIIKNQQDMVLLGLRKNQPARNFWFVPGGRIRKNETLNMAFKRVLHDETSLSLEDVFESKIKGIYEHIYESNYFDEPNVSTHYVVIACELRIKKEENIKFDFQNSEFRFFTVEEINTSPLVHEFTKKYFVNQPENKFLMDLK